jgi:hypothetical protein
VDANTLLAWGDLATLALAAGTFYLAKKNRDLVKESKLARDQWTSMAIETARTRLDAKAPSVDLTVGAITPPLIPSTDGGKAVPCPPGQRWTFDRDEKEVLLVRCEVGLVNSGPKTAYIKVRGFRALQIASDGEEEYGDTFAMTLPSGQRWAFWIEACLTLKDWAENHRRAEAGQPMKYFGMAMIDAYDDDDNGVTDWWWPILTGAPIMPIPGDTADWQLRPSTDPLAAHLQEDTPARGRTYWLSRSQNKMLPLPPDLEEHYKELEQKRRRENPDLYALIEQAQPDRPIAVPAVPPTPAATTAVPPEATSDAGTAPPTTDDADAGSELLAERAWVGRPGPVRVIG